MPNFCARIESHIVVNDVFTYNVSAMAADGASYQLTVDVPGSELTNSLASFNTTIKDAIEAKLLSEFEVTVGPGNKIALMGGAV